MALGQPEAQFRAALRALIVGDLYELVGKVRNAQHARFWAALPFLAVQTAFYGAMLLGLAHRHLYTRGERVFVESLELGDPPQGFCGLAEKVIAGWLDDPHRLATAPTLRDAMPQAFFCFHAKLNNFPTPKQRQTPIP